MSIAANTVTAIPAPKFDLVEVVDQEDFEVIYPLLLQLLELEAPESIETMTMKKSWAQYQKAREQNYRLFAARNANEALGIGGIRICDDPFSTYAYAVINNLVIEEDYRGLGIGSDLLARLELLAKKEKCNSVCLAVLQGSKQARKLYERLGFQSVAHLMIKEFTK